VDEVKVSVCMVTYNHERYIAQAISSVLEQQTSFPIEVIVGEDCSTDGTRQIVEEFAAANPSLIQLRLAERNQGGKLNFTGTLGQARGEYVVILEGDDYFTDPLKLQRQVEALDSRPDWAICFHPARCHYEGDLLGPAFTPENWDRGEATIIDLFERNFIPTSGAMFRRRLTGALPPWFMEIDAGDWALHILNAAHGNIGFLPEPMSAYRIHSAGFWSGRSVEQRVVSIFKLLTAVDHHFQGKYASEIDRNRITTVRWLFGEWHNAAEESRKTIEILGIMTTGDRPRLRLTVGANNETPNREQQILAEQAIAAADFPSLARKLETLLNERAWLQEAHHEWTHSIAYRVSREIQRPWKQFQSAWRRFRRGSAATVDDASPPAAKAA
jgi:glycosyltransferase involved in cell wall biosynthesis